MLRLIIKDFSAFWYVLIFQLVVVLSLMSFAVFLDGNGNMTYIVLVLYPMILPTVLLLSDQKFLTLCCSLPIPRGRYVLAKYFGGMFFAITLMGIGLTYGYITSTYLTEGALPFYKLISFEGVIMLLVPIVLLNSFTFPVFFAFSKEKGGFVLTMFFIVCLLALILGLVYLEKTIPTSVPYNKQDIFPVVIGRLQRHIQDIGPVRFRQRLVGGTLAFLGISVVSSLVIVRHKDIGGA